MGAQGKLPQSPPPVGGTVGNHKVTVVPVVLQVFNCEVDLTTVVTRMLIRYHFLCYPNPRKMGNGKCSILVVRDK